MGKAVKSVTDTVSTILGGGKKIKIDTPQLQGADQIVSESQRLGKQAEQRGQFVAPIQQQYIQQLQQQTMGQGPSLAQAQLKAAQERTLAQQLAAAQASRGGNPAALQRALLRQTGEQQRGLAQDAAQARIQEQMDARQLLAQQIAQEREAADRGAAAGLDRTLTLRQAQLGAESSAAQARAQAEAQRSANQFGLLGGLISGAATLGAAKLGGGKVSDERLKKDVKSGDKATAAFVEALSKSVKPKSFKYKDQDSHGEGEQLGIMAQDLEKVPGGKQMVKKSADGVRYLDPASGFGAVLAAQAHLAERLKALESKSKKKG